MLLKFFNKKIMTKINKIMKMVKDQFFILALLAMFVGFSAFSFASQFQNSFETTMWYPVASNGETIINSPQSEAPEDEDCLLENDGTICFIELTFEGTTPPATVSTAHSNPNIDVGDEYKREAL